MTRYAILHHRERAGEHWDLLIETGSALATWKLEADPTLPGALPIAGVRIQDHREEYLAYEGQVAGNRGHVTRADEGRCLVAQRTNSVWRFELQGGQLTGRLRLARGPSERWVLETDRDEPV